VTGRQWLALGAILAGAAVLGFFGVVLAWPK
jgi:hypothetical protein